MENSITKLPTTIEEINTLLHTKLESIDTKTIDIILTKKLIIANNFFTTKRNTKSQEESDKVAHVIISNFLLTTTPNKYELVLNNLLNVYLLGTKSFCNVDIIPDNSGQIIFKIDNKLNLLRNLEILQEKKIIIKNTGVIVSCISDNLKVGDNVLLSKNFLNNPIDYMIPNCDYVSSVSITDMYPIIDSLKDTYKDEGNFLYTIFLYMLDFLDIMPTLDTSIYYVGTKFDIIGKCK